MFVGGDSAWRDGKWHQMTVTWDVDKDAKLYVDGVENSTFTAVKDELESSHTLDRWDNPMRIGAAGRSEERHDMNGIQSTLDGCLDEVGVWKERLTGIQAAALHNLMKSSLKYGTLDAEILFGVFARGEGAFGKTSDGKTWKYATGLSGAAGTVVEDKALILDDKGNGVQLDQK